VPDYLQNIIDRSLGDPPPDVDQVDNTSMTPDQRIEEVLKRKKLAETYRGFQLAGDAARRQQLNDPNYQSPVASTISNYFSNPPNPNYGKPVAPPTAQQPQNWQTALRPPVPPAPPSSPEFAQIADKAGLTPAVPFQSSPYQFGELKPYQVPSSDRGQAVPLGSTPPPAPTEALKTDVPPMPPPTEIKNAPVREADGAPATVPNDVLRRTAGATTMQPDQGQLGQAGQQAGMLGALGNVGNWLGQHSNALLAMGAGLMGAPNVWQGLGRGFSYMGPAAQQDIKMQTLMSGQNAAFNALISAGVPRDLAMAGATDKDVMKQLMEEYFTGKTQSVQVKLPNGVEVTAQYDPHRGTYTDIYGRPFDPNQPGMGGSLIDPSLTGEAARAEAERSVDPATYRRAMGYVSGNLPWPVGRAMTDPRNKQATDLALQIDPNLAQASGQLRNQTILDYGPKGKTGQTRLALSNMMGHAEQLDKLNEIIGNWDAGGERANRARDALKTLLGTDKTYLDAKAQAELLRTVLAGEANKAFSGSHSVTGTEEMIKALGTDKGHTAQHGAIKGMIHAAGTRLGELQSQFDSSMNTKSEGYHMLSPKAQKIFRKWEGDAGMDWDAKAPANLPEGTDAAEAFAPIAGAKAAPAVQGTAGPANLPHVKTPAEAQALPPNTRFIDPNGVERIRP
jgi:hypothetical protein